MSAVTTRQGKKTPLIQLLIQYHLSFGCSYLPLMLLLSGLRSITC